VFIKVIVGGWNLNVDSREVLQLDETGLIVTEPRIEVQSSDQTSRFKIEIQNPHPPAKSAGRVGHPRVIQSGFTGGQEFCGVLLIELLQDVIA
jgi:hypothetical protein